MSKILVIKAHPLTKEQSKSVAVLDTFLNEYKSLNSEEEIQLVDLYSDFIPEIDAEMMLGWQKLASGTELSDVEAKKVNRFSELTAQFLAADKIIIANPLWNLQIPTRLKAWIDTINVAGKTFAYTEEGPKGLTSGKKLMHIQSNGGTYGGQDPAAQYIKMVFNFIGVENVQHLAVEGIDYNPDQKETILKEAHSKAKELAREF